MQYVPVRGSTGKPLMPCHPARARELVRRGRAIKRFDRGIFYIQLHDRDEGELQRVVVGIDPGSKKEAITIKSQKRTFLNIQADAVTWVKDAEETSTTMRRSRRGRKTPYRKCRPNRHQGRIPLPPSTKARWQLKLRLFKSLARSYPIHVFMVEDVKAETRKGKGGHWNTSFSAIQLGKDSLYSQVCKPCH